MRPLIGFLMDGERPARVPDAVIDELKSRERDGVITRNMTPEVLLSAIGRTVLRDGLINAVLDGLTSDVARSL